MNNSKLQQVFYRIILNSLNDNKKGLHKEANFLSYILQPFRSLWDFGRALRNVSGMRQQLRDIGAALRKGNKNPIPQETIDSLKESLKQFGSYLDDQTRRRLETFLNYLPKNDPKYRDVLRNTVPALYRRMSTWQLIKDNPFKTTGLVLGVPAVGVGGYYGTRGLVRNLTGTDPDTTRRTIEEGISEGLKKALQDTGLGESRGAQQPQQPPKVMPSTIPNTVSAEQLNKLMTSYLLRSNKTASDIFSDNITRNSGNLSPNIKKKSFFSKSAEGNQNKSILETVGSLMDPLVSLTGKDPNSISNISKLLLLSGLTAGTASLFKRKNKWLPWLGGGLVLSGLGSSYFLDPKSQQEGQNAVVATGGGNSSGDSVTINQQQ